MDYMKQEIFEEAEACRKTIERGERELPTLARELVKRNFDSIYLTGCGSSHFAGIVGRYTLQEHCRVPSVVSPALDLLHYGLAALSKRPLVFAISQSGESYETLDIAQAAKERDAFVIGVTNNEHSTLAELADEIITTEAGPERGPGAKTVLVQELVLYHLSLYWGLTRATLTSASFRSLIEELMEMPALVQQCLDREAELATLAQSLQNIEHLYIVGAGPFFPSALQFANILKEVGKVHGEGFEVGEFRHGPMEILDESDWLLITSASSCRLSERVAELARTAQHIGTTVVGITDQGDRGLLDNSSFSFSTPPQSEILSSITTLCPLHLLTYHLARRRGLEPNELRNIVKTWRKTG